MSRRTVPQLIISLTDMAKYRNPEATGLVISHWLSTRYAVDYLGIWERVNNPDFNITEFSNIRNQAGTNGYVKKIIILVNLKNTHSIYHLR